MSCATCSTPQHIKGAEHETARRMYREAVGDEVAHAQYLAG
jgi:hypothetical protein